jgi:hypothetical protein
MNLASLVASNNNALLFEEDGKSIIVRRITDGQHPLRTVRLCSGCRYLEICRGEIGQQLDIGVVEVSRGTVIYAVYKTRSTYDS